MRQADELEESDGLGEGDELGEGDGVGERISAGPDEGEFDNGCVGVGEGRLLAPNLGEGSGECIATTNRVAPKANATKRKKRLETDAATSAPKSLKFPPRMAINTRIDPKTNAPIFKFSGMNLLSDLGLMIAA